MHRYVLGRAEHCESASAIKNALAPRVPFLLAIVWTLQPAVNAQLAWFVNLDSVHRGRIHDVDAMEAALRDIDAMPDASAPTVVYIQSIDSRYAWPMNAGHDSSERIDIVVSTLADIGAPPAIFVATPWGTPEDRIADSQVMGWDEVPIYPTTAEDLATHGYDWLVEPDAFALRWDLDGTIPFLTANRQTSFGREVISPVTIVLCANDSGILGWARSYRQYEATPAALGTFTTACANGELTGLPEDYALPASVLADYGLAETWLVILLPDAYAHVVDLQTATKTLSGILDQATPPIPIVYAASSTVGSDFAHTIDADTHRQALADAGIPIDGEFSDALPTWVYDYATLPVTTALLVDPSGHVVGYYGVSSNNPANLPILQHQLLREGLY